MIISLNDSFNCSFEGTDIPSSNLSVPGTIQASKIAPHTQERDTGNLTDEHEYSGTVMLSRQMTIPQGYDSYIISIERSRITKLYIDGQPVGRCDSLIAPHIYDITSYLTREDTLIQIEIDNKNYPCPGGHLTSKDTQTNWSGILGDVYIKCTNKAHIVSASVKADYDKKSAYLTINVAKNFPSDKVNIKVQTSLCKLLDKYLNKDADPSEFKKFRDDISIAAKGTDYDILKEYLEITEDILKPQEFTESSSTDSKSFDHADTKHINAKYAYTSYIKTDSDNNNDSISDNCSGNTHDGISDNCSDTNICSFTYELDLTASDKGVFEWDTFTPYLYVFDIDLCDESGSVLDSTKAVCGLRSLKADGNDLLLNNRPIFLRGRHCGLLFPMTGFAPMNACGWLYDMMISRRWGINHYRFHSCTPPDAAFLAADLLGIVIQSEMEIWGSWLMEDEEGYDATMQQYLTMEGYRMISLFASHPSFCMFGCGNELWGNPKALGKLLAGFKMINPDLLYTQGSNTFQFSPNIQPEDDFFVGVRFSTDRLIRGSYALCDGPSGHIQTMPPRADYTYDANIRPDLITEQNNINNTAGILESDSTKADRSRSNDPEPDISEPASTTTIQFGTTVKEVALTSKEELIPHIPVISHETGQFETYPDYDEIDHYTGVLKAYNIAALKDNAIRMGLFSNAGKFFKNSGALAMQCYKHEMEDALASRYLAGTQLLDLQDYAGQGTALIGILNSLMENKGLISPEKFRQSWDDIVVMARFRSYIHTPGESFTFEPMIAYYDKTIYPDMIFKAMLISYPNESDCNKNIECNKNADCSKNTDCNKNTDSNINADCNKTTVYNRNDNTASYNDIIIRSNEICCDSAIIKVPFIKSQGRITLPRIALNFPEGSAPERLELRLYLIDSSDNILAANTYTLYSYPKVPESIISSAATDFADDPYVTTSAAAAISKVQEGHNVLLYLKDRENTNSIAGTYCTDFWCYPMFKSISESMNKPVAVGTLGLSIDDASPALKTFNTRTYSEPNWYEIVTASRSTILDDTNIEPIVATIDNASRSHRLGLLYEIQIEGTDAYILVCTSDIPRLITSNVKEAYALHKSLLSYVKDTSKHENANKITSEIFNRLFTAS
ncbi:hypothetical protein [Butyrivibrio sp. TB]|uniref:hypothetical protein n=1 Tax=Butyrivibrio sp. TB TaxID=1520809 RepID=UPI0008D10F95|nr:hypothetical protein [Butyrivibrio sp. TB]SEP60610.1 hypothetical protein SAMN02910382_00473 [Butyrivibrio sp. TB]